MIRSRYDQYNLLISKISILNSRLNEYTESILEIVGNLNKNTNQQYYLEIDLEAFPEFKDIPSLILDINNAMYYNSLVLYIDSVLEHSLKMICQYIFDNNISNEKYPDVNRDILKNTWKYILSTQLVSFNDKDLSKHYDTIIKVNKLRNLITHNNCNIIKFKTKPIKKQLDYNLFYSDKRLTILETGQIYIKDVNYINSFITSQNLFLGEILKKIKT